jgi:hypothetical protein
MPIQPVRIFYCTHTWLIFYRFQSDLAILMRRAGRVEVWVNKYFKLFFLFTHDSSTNQSLLSGATAIEGYSCDWIVGVVYVIIIVVAELLKYFLAKSFTWYKIVSILSVCRAFCKTAITLAHKILESITEEPRWFFSVFDVSVGHAHIFKLEYCFYIDVYSFSGSISKVYQYYEKTVIIIIV